MTQYNITISKQKDGSFVISGDDRPFIANSKDCELVFNLVPVGFVIQDVCVGYTRGVTTILAEQLSWTSSGSVITMTDACTVAGTIHVYFGFQDKETGYWRYFDPVIENEEPPAA